MSSEFKVNPKCINGCVSGTQQGTLWICSTCGNSYELPKFLTKVYPYWEYKTAIGGHLGDRNGDTEKYLNDMGKIGWELVTVTFHAEGLLNSAHSVLYFKRKIEKEK